MPSKNIPNLCIHIKIIFHINIFNSWVKEVKVRFTYTYNKIDIKIINIIFYRIIEHSGSEGTCWLYQIVSNRHDIQNEIKWSQMKFTYFQELCVNIFICLYYFCGREKRNRTNINTPRDINANEPKTGSYFKFKSTSLLFFSSRIFYFIFILFFLYWKNILNSLIYLTLRINYKAIQDVVISLFFFLYNRFFLFYFSWDFLNLYPHEAI